MYYRPQYFNLAPGENNSRYRLCTFKIYFPIVFIIIVLLLIGLCDPFGKYPLLAKKICPFY